MGRHGGGSRSGGSRSSSSRSRSRSGSRSGGSSVRSSKTPFKGCYNRSYYHNGRYHPYYTTDAGFGTKATKNVAAKFIAIFITIHMLIVLTVMFSTMLSIGDKANGDQNRIGIVDNIDILTTQEENSILKLFNEVYDKSGMPITLITDNYTWMEYYDSIEVYSEELYYSIGFDEESMVILFTQEDLGGFVDWEYDMYCGDDTVKCLSDATFDELLDNFQKAMAKQDLYYALDYAWGSIMDKLAKTTFDSAGIPVIFFVLCFYSIFYYAALSSGKNRKRAEKYFKEHPEALSDKPMTLYNECPNCGAQNTTMSETCLYCGSVLKLSDDNVVFVSPK